jgi:hypothetical protein
MATAKRIWAGQGPVFLGDWNDTLMEVENQYQIGCGNRSLQTTLESAAEVLKESCSGYALDLAEFTTGQSMKLNLEMQEFSQKELAIALYGDVQTKAAGTGNTTTIQQTIADGDIFHIPAGASNISIEDSAGTPIPLVAGTNYKVLSADFGTIQFLDTAGFTQPFVVTHNNAAYDYIQPLTKTAVVKSLIFNGTSKVDGSKAQIIIPKLRFPPSTVDWLSDKAGSLNLQNARCLFANVPEGGELGGYGVVRYL